ncbi:MAG: VOC family protein [Acidimicrobiales bacterium]|nr:VOC family protein [Acidimicrobiales bacterium]
MARLNHVGLTVSDVERSIEFYTEVVGFEVFSRRSLGGEWFDTLTEHPDHAELDVAMLRLGDMVLQLVQYVEGGDGALALDHHRVGSPHLCIDVDDVLMCLAAAQARTGLRVGPLIDAGELGFRSFYVRDPDGVPVELLQRG